MSLIGEEYDAEEREQLPPISQEEQQVRQQRVEEIRSMIQGWKKELLNTMTNGNQDTLVLNQFRNELTNLFYLLRDVMEGYDPSEKLQAHPLWTSLKVYFPLYDGVERIDLTHMLWRDLVEFPFTFNQKLINAFIQKNSLKDAEILPNK